MAPVAPGTPCGPTTPIVTVSVSGATVNSTIGGSSQEHHMLTAL